MADEAIRMSVFLNFQNRLDKSLSKIDKHLKNLVTSVKKLERLTINPTIRLNDQASSQITLIEGTLNKLNNTTIRINLDYSSINGGSYSSKGIKRLAEGGIVSSPMQAVIGEAGPEAIIPLSPRFNSEATSIWQQTGWALGMNPNFLRTSGPKLENNWLPWLGPTPANSLRSSTIDSRTNSAHLASEGISAKINNDLPGTPWDLTSKAVSALGVFADFVERDLSIKTNTFKPISNGNKSMKWPKLVEKLLLKLNKAVISYANVPSKRFGNLGNRFAGIAAWYNTFSRSGEDRHRQAFIETSSLLPGLLAFLGPEGAVAGLAISLLYDKEIRNSAGWLYDWGHRGHHFLELTDQIGKVMCNQLEGNHLLNSLAWFGKQANRINDWYFGDWFWNSKKYASGGILSTPHFGLVAEAGPEAIIPLDPSKRSRGTALWEKAGRIMGLNPVNAGGMYQVAPAQSGGGLAGVNVSSSVNVNWQGAGVDEEAMAYTIGRRIVSDIKARMQNAVPATA